MPPARPKFAVVGHVEWVTFARVRHTPRAGEIVHAEDPFEEPAGGGAVAAVQLARLAGAAVLVTALGEDERGRRSVVSLIEADTERVLWSRSFEGSMRDLVMLRREAAEAIAREVQLRF